MKKFKLVRWIILGAILVGTMVLNFLHIHSGNQYPSAHAICPVGGLENLWSWLAGAGNLQKLFSGTMTLFFFLIIFTLIFGRAFCGTICPFGTLQELFGKITKKKIQIPEKIDRILRKIKYVILAFVTVMAWITFSIWISPYDPYAAFAHIWSGEELFLENGIGFIILIVVLASSIFIDRFFCKYLCPAGAMYGGICKIGATKVKHDNCTNCGLCSKACPMGIDVKTQNVVKSGECIACGECVAACPTQQANMKITIFGKAVKPILFILLAVGIFFGSLFVFDAVGLYQVTVPTIEDVQENKNYIKISDLRGSMTIEMGSIYTGIELAEFYDIMEIPREVPKDTRLKEVVYYVPGYDFHVIKASK